MQPQQQYIFTPNKVKMTTFRRSTSNKVVEQCRFNSNTYLRQTRSIWTTSRRSTSNKVVEQCSFNSNIYIYIYAEQGQDGLHPEDQQAGRFPEGQNCGLEMENENMLEISMTLLTLSEKNLDVRSDPQTNRANGATT